MFKRNILLVLFIVFITSNNAIGQQTKQEIEIIFKPIQLKIDKKDIEAKQIWQDSCSARWLDTVNSFSKKENLAFEKVVILSESFLDVVPEGTFAQEKYIMRYIDSYRDVFLKDNYFTKKHLKERLLESGLLTLNCFIPLALIQIYIGDEKIEWWNFAIVQPYVEFDCTKYESTASYIKFLNKKGVKREIELPNYKKDFKLGEILIEYERHSGAMGIIYKRIWEIYSEKEKILEPTEVFIRCIFLPIPKECEINDFIYYSELYRKEMELHQNEQKDACK